MICGYLIIALRLFFYNILVLPMGINGEYSGKNETLPFLNTALHSKWVGLIHNPRVLIPKRGRGQFLEKSIERLQAVKTNHLSGMGVLQG
jgi:hypothetical protein